MHKWSWPDISLTDLPRWPHSQQQHATPAVLRCLHPPGHPTRPKPPPKPVPLAAMALVPPLATTGLPRIGAHASGLPPPTPHANAGRRLSKSGQPAAHASPTRLASY
eukprot:scaffold45779_cov59-Phaeocystis_antarctica.AAC.2